MYKTVSLICLFTALVSAQDMYIGPYEAQAQFDSISADKINRIRHQRVLFGGRSWSGAVAGSYVGNLGSEYALNWKPRISLAGTDTIPHNAFSSPGVVHFGQPDLTPGRWTTFADIIRGRNGFKEFGLEIDIAFQFLYAGGGLWEAYHPLFDSLRDEYPNVKFGICTHHVSADSTNDPAWNLYGNQYSDSVMATYAGKIPVLDLRMIAAIGPDGDTATFEYNGHTYPQMCSTYQTPDHIHMKDYTTLCKGFYMMLDLMTPDTGYVDTGGFPVDSGMITVYVDPTAGGAGDGTSWENAYTNLALAELFQRADLVARDASITFKCRGGVDNMGVTFDPANWTVDAGHFITVEVAKEDRHDGTRGTGYVLAPPAYTMVLYILTPYTVINGVAVDGSKNGRSAVHIAAANCVIMNSLVYDVPAPFYVGINIAVSGVKLINNVIYDCELTGINIGYSQDLILYNNTVLNCGTALSITNHAVYITNIKNCYFGSVSSDSVIANGLSMAGVTFTTTHTSSGQYGTTVTAPSSAGGAFFVSADPGSENAHIRDGSALYTAGTDLSSDPAFPFSFDAAGTFRNDGAYSVGAYEYSVTSVRTVVPVVEFTPALNRQDRMYDINGAPAAAEQSGVYFGYDKEAKTLRKMMVIGK